jgi:hypothetical protein
MVLPTSLAGRIRAGDNGEMDQDGSSRPPYGCLLIAIALAIVVVYPLSAGPMAMLVDLDVLPASAWVRLYWPLMWIDETALRTVFGQRPFKWYLCLFTDC